MKAHVEFVTAPARTARTVQASSMFDVPLNVALRRTFDHDLPFETTAWNVGLIVGPSGSGKTILARELWGSRVDDEPHWSSGSVLDDFPADVGVRDVVGALTAVGLSSTPAWFRPYSTLSNGERFRADMARRLLTHDDPVVVDEFTSVVDRQVAQVASHALQKSIRRSGSRFVAVSCHRDIVDWLQPDWVYDTSTLVFTWRHVRRHPPLNLAIHEASVRDWPLFAPHHYLSAKIHGGATCYVATLDDTLCAFASHVHFPHPRTRNIRQSHRVVVLPDFQGLGIAGRITDWEGEMLHRNGFRLHATTAHPARIAYFSRSPRWRTGAPNNMRRSPKARYRPDSRQYVTRTFIYVPEPPREAQRGAPSEHRPDTRAGRAATPEGTQRA